MFAATVLRIAPMQHTPPTASVAAPADVKAPAETAQVEDEPALSTSIVTSQQISSWKLIKEIWRHVSPNWLLLLTIVAVTSASAAINVYMPLLIGKLIAVVQEVISQGGSPNLAALNEPAFNLLGLFGAQGLLTFLDITLVAKLGEDLAISLRRELYAAILRQDMSFFDARMQGEIIGRLSEDVASFKHTFKLCVTQGLKATSQIVGSVYNLVHLSSSLTLTLVSTMPPLYLFMNFYGAYLRRLSQQARVGDSQASGVAGEAVSNIRTVRAFASEDVETQKYVDAAHRSSMLNTYLGFHIGLFQSLANTSIGSMILVILYFGGRMVAQGKMTAGQLMAYVVSTQNAQHSFVLVGVLFAQVIKALGSAARVFEYIHLQPTIPLRGGLVPRGLRGDIEFKDVEFTYPTRPDQTILERFSLRIPAGSVVALCGASGSGKSTVGQLIERFYEPQKGTVLLDGTDIRKIDPRWLREHIGYINQEPVLFATSIVENIRYGRPDATDEEVREAARQANAADFIESFPDKYETAVGERGVTLSGGAILKDPKVLILDEATSALDTQSERIVQDALERLMRGRTVLVIAHRLSTIQAASRIVVLSGADKQTRATGNVVETGTHAELLKQRGAYYKLYTQTEL
ncbi:hypothetical protein HK105_205861 [Polyrhizophydium stewartii]|uniref:Mitochondrial potassium channel ATP-binding subunit n=1 Tax=Polyrhizophydium stewartii TaxID=2732419 RepID=A0ABR4N4N0_9FUNG